MQWLAQATPPCATVVLVIVRDSSALPVTLYTQLCRNPNSPHCCSARASKQQCHPFWNSPATRRPWRVVLLCNLGYLLLLCLPLSAGKVAREDDPPFMRQASVTRAACSFCRHEHPAQEEGGFNFYASERDAHLSRLEKRKHRGVSQKSVAASGNLYGCLLPH